MKIVGQRLVVPTEHFYVTMKSKANLIVELWVNCKAGHTNIAEKLKECEDMGLLE